MARDRAGDTVVTPAPRLDSAVAVVAGGTEAAVAVERSQGVDR